MCIFRLSRLYLLVFICMKSTFASPKAYIVKTYQLEINNFLKVESPTYINVNDCLHIESSTSWQTLQESASQIDNWDRFEIKKEDYGLYFVGEICK